MFLGNEKLVCDSPVHHGHSDDSADSRHILPVLLMFFAVVIGVGSIEKINFAYIGYNSRYQYRAFDLQ